MRSDFLGECAQFLGLPEAINRGQYLVPRGSDLPLRDLEIEMLPALPDEKPKGIAEVVMVPVVPALLNAIHDATGQRFNALPVTQSLLKGALA